MLKQLVMALSLLIISSTAIFAAGFQLKAIGAMDVTGTMSKEWWYTSDNPALSGITTVGSTVTVSIDGTDYEASVDELGNWSYTPTVLISGDHTVNLTSSAGSQSFTLHIGEVPADVSAPSQSETPVVGSTAQTLALWLGGGLIIAAGLALLPIKK